MPLHCIICDRPTPMNFADERFFDCVYCEKCAPKLLAVSPEHHRSVLHKSIDPAVRWGLNLANLNAHAFGDPSDPETMLRYWKAQEAAGYPGASENVLYFKDVIAKEGKT